MSFLINKAKKDIGKKLKKILFKIIKPILPFLLLIIVVIFLISYLLDSIFVSSAQTDSCELSAYEQQIKNMCIEKAEYLNTCNNFVGSEKRNELLDVNNLENTKIIEWSHLYTIMTLENLNNKAEINKQLLDKISASFKSTFKYEKDTIKTEIKEVKDEKETWKVDKKKSQTQYILVESNTIIGHYKYEYETVTEVSDDGNTRTTKKKYKKEKLQGKEYERLENYFKKSINLNDEDIKTCINLVINSATGYYDENAIENTFLGNSRFTWPIPGYTNITSEYGYRVHPISRRI